MGGLVCDVRCVRMCVMCGRVGVGYVGGWV